MKYDVGAKKKALLLETGLLFLPGNDYLNLIERSTAGPDAGLNSIFLRFGRHRVRMVVTKKSDATPFKLKKSGGDFLIMKDDAVFIRPIFLEKPFFHAPNQFFLNLASTCIFDCKFCATPKLKVRFMLTPERVVQLLDSVMRSGGTVEGIAITSGLVDSEEKTVDLLIETVKLLRKEVGNQIPIGVEPYVTKLDHIDAIYSSGADELKINVESFDREIMRRVCPNLDYEKIASVLKHSADVFGKNKVCSNVLVGLGESDRNLLDGLVWMAKMGVVANLKPLFISPYRNHDIAEATQKRAARPNAARILKLALSYRSILEKYGLQTSRFCTMCHKCTGCEIAPQQDL